MKCTKVKVTTLIPKWIQLDATNSQLDVKKTKSVSEKMDLKKVLKRALETHYDKIFDDWDRSKNQQNDKNNCLELRAIALLMDRFKIKSKRLEWWNTHDKL